MNTSVPHYSSMQVGDRVRLNQLFIPTATSIKGYRYATICDFLRRDASDPMSEIMEILVHLCDGDRTLFHVDEWGIRPLYSFDPDEIECIGDRCFSETYRPNNRHR